jgi:GNAT superfamily N-acetyltransferase
MVNPKTYNIPQDANVKAGHRIEALNDGTHILIRPLDASDRNREFEFIKNLSPESRHFRFLSTMNEASSTLLDQLMDLDYTQRMAYVALIMEGGHLIEIGVSRYAAMDGNSDCECAVAVADQWQRRGLGTLLMRALIDAARSNGFKRMISIDSSSNTHMHRLADDMGFSCEKDPLDSSQVIYGLELN